MLSLEIEYALELVYAVAVVRTGFSHRTMV
jgi:hypothetical protein